MIDPILFKLGPVTIRWYGLAAVLALLAAFLYSQKISRWRRLNINLENLFFWTIIAGLLGARLYHVFNELPFYLQHPELILQIWRGGLAIHGGALAGALTLLHFSRRRQISFWKLADVFAPALLLALAIGRWGNFFNQELFGRPTSLPWGIFIDLANRPAAFAHFTHFHPTFLYQLLWNLLAVILITLWIKKTPPAKNGLIFSISLIAWGTGRFLVELLRIDSVPLILGLRLPMLVSLLISIIGMFSFVYLKKTHGSKSVKTF